MTIFFEFWVFFSLGSIWPGTTIRFLVSLLSIASFWFSPVDFNTEILWKTFSGKTRAVLLMLVSLSSKNCFLMIPSYTFCTSPQSNYWKDSLSSCFFKRTLVGSLMVSLISERILERSVPIVSQRIKPDLSVLFNKCLAPPEPLIILLFCSCIWSIANVEN